MFFLELSYLIMALFDAWFTTKRIPQIGIEAEYNPLIRWLTARFGIKAGIYAGVMLPTLLLMALGLKFTSLFVYLIGARSTLFGFQLRVLKELNNGFNPTYLSK